MAYISAGFRFIFILILLGIWCAGFAQNTDAYAHQKNDWLVHKKQMPAQLKENKNEKIITITNGMTQRSFYLGENLVCFDYTNLVSGQQLIRSVRPEARITINGTEYNVGGLYGQKEHAYFVTSWLKELKADKRDFVYTSHEWTSLTQPVNWKATDWAGNRNLPTGKSLVLSFKNNSDALKDILVKVHYDVFDNIPVLCKRVTIENKSNATITINQVVNEILAMPEEESAVAGDSARMAVPHGIFVESNYAFNDAMRYHMSDQTTNWKSDPLYRSQVHVPFKTPCLLEIYPKEGIGFSLKAGNNFNSIRTYELLLDSHDRERRGLARKKFYRTVAPWVTRNPIFMHLIAEDTAQIRRAIDQCVATGYEAVILSFGSALNMEDTSAANLKMYKEIADYAHSKNILIGGYALFISRSISPDVDVINPHTGKPGQVEGGSSPCMASAWGIEWLAKVKNFFAKTGFDMFENDGPYGGDVCASTKHTGHKGLEDSQWAQIELQKELYRHLNERGVYINAPDWYFLDGSNKAGIGYREPNFTLPRERQKILNRQNIYDAMWEEIPSMAWGFVPLTEYGGGGAAATIEPLKDHLDMYEQLMMQYYGSGVQACYRGPRLYDTDTTKKLVQSVITWYKKYRDILNSDLIHLRRADARDWDGMMHVNAGLQQKALAMLYNPLTTPVQRTIKLPLYYTGLNKTAKIRVKEGSPKTYALNGACEATVTVTISAESYTWLVVE
ncbi:MAG: alpha-galactosidase [Chitinophagaceae bacterium]|nr:alpha-galactosidase [Chitinophagaceae bacterium]